jgi:hypothetical protein
MRENSFLEACIQNAKNDKAVYISDVRQRFLADTGSDVYIDVLKFDGQTVRFSLRLPYWDNSAEKKRFVQKYLFAELYNILSALGGRKLDIYADKKNKALGEVLSTIPEAFGINATRRERRAYGRAINVIERMIDASSSGGKFELQINDIEKMPALPSPPSPHIDFSTILNNYKKAFDGINSAVLLGIDVGGTDIKAAVSFNGRLCFLKEYDWFPALFTRSAQLIEPIVLLTRLLRARVSAEINRDAAPLRAALDRAIDNHLPDRELLEIVENAESVLGANLVNFDSIGLSFPDVVVKDKIVGGEVFKTRGIRENPDIEYEAEFGKLTNLDQELARFCVKGAQAHIINDGPMAAFTAAIELIAQHKEALLQDGRFAHTLGTELGTGWIDEAGEIPEIPLEVYNFIIDLGSLKAAEYPSDDLRSINNFNTGLAGTLQKFMAQNGVFRLAIKASLETDGKLYRELLDKKFIYEKDGAVFVALEGGDMRKPLLEYLMKRAEEGDREMEEVFVEIGRSTGITFCETVHILSPLTPERVMYGRLVKMPHCFALIKKGAAQTAPDAVFTVADEQSAFSSLMVQLKNHPKFTVAQFAQAIGAIYYGQLFKETPLFQKKCSQNSANHQ